MRRRRKVFSNEDDAGVDMSPLIDCVFLLLIFFLVTTIIKRKEKQIRVDMPDNSASVAAKSSMDTLILGLNRDGTNLAPTGKLNYSGAILWKKIPSISAYLKKQIEIHGAQILDKPLRIDADPETPFQKAINTLDICKLQGFSKVSIKMRQPEKKK